MTASRLVYDSEHGRMCPDCEKSVQKCICRKKRDTQPPMQDGPVRVSRETKGRKGKGVTMVTGLPLSGDDLRALATKLKSRLGTGGSVKEGVIEIQGDHRDKLVEALNKLGFKAKRSGG